MNIESGDVFGNSAAGYPSGAGEESGAGEDAGRREAPHDAAEGGGEQRDYEAEAKEMGWVPQDQYHDDPTKWVDAKDFVERGEHILPILRANNKKIKKELSEREAQLKELRDSLEAQKQVLKTLKKHYTESTAREVEAAKRDLIAQLKAAKEVGDVDAELKVTEALDELKEKQKESKESADLDRDPTELQPPPKLDPEYVQWQNENPWFGDTTNKENRLKTKEVLRIAEDFREDGDTQVGRPFLLKCVEEYNRRHKVTAISKVESGTRGTGGPTGGRAYDRLPKEAKEACMEDKDLFVGPGKKFKEVREWQDEFAALYNEDK